MRILKFEPFRRERSRDAGWFLRRGKPLYRDSGELSSGVIALPHCCVTLNAPGAALFLLSNACEGPLVPPRNELNDPWRIQAPVCPPTKESSLAPGWSVLVPFHVAMHDQPPRSSPLLGLADRPLDDHANGGSTRFITKLCDYLQAGRGCCRPDINSFNVLQALAHNGGWPRRGGQPHSPTTRTTVIRTQQQSCCTSGEQRRSQTSS